MQRGGVHFADHIKDALAHISIVSLLSIDLRSQITDMLFSSLAFVAALAPSVLGCPQHSNNKRSHLQGRQTNPAQNSNANTTQNIWAYEVCAAIE